MILLSYDMLSCYRYIVDMNTVKHVENICSLRLNKTDKYSNF